MLHLFCPYWLGFLVSSRSQLGCLDVLGKLLTTLCDRAVAISGFKIISVCDIGSSLALQLAKNKKEKNRYLTYRPGTYLQLLGRR